MPFFKDSFTHGNLFVEFEVEFPKQGSLKPEQLKILKSILPGNKSLQLEKKIVPFFLDDVEESEMNPNPEGGKFKSKYIRSRKLAAAPPPK